jgi:hypothetical protein
MSGITKLIANLEATTSPIGLNIDGCRKDDILILSTGNMDVVRNGMNNGLRHLTSISISISIYLRSFDPRKGYCPLDIEHVISIHNTIRYQIYNLSQYKIVGYRSCQYIIQCDTGE